MHASLVTAITSSIMLAVARVGRQTHTHTCADGLQDEGSHLAAVYQAHAQVAAALHLGHHLQPFYPAPQPSVDQVQTA